MRATLVVTLALALACALPAPAALLDVPLPLVPPPEVPETMEEAEEVADPLLVPGRAKEAPTLPAPRAPTAAIVATTGGILAALAGIALYSRLSRSTLLDHERRGALRDLVHARPGVSLSEAAERCGIGWGAAVHHFQQLERAGLVVSQRVAGRRCFFPVGTVARESRAKLGALQQPTTRSVASFVAQRPGATQGEVASALGLSASATSKQITKLESAGLIRRERAWKNVRLLPGDALASLLAAPGARA